MSSNKKIVKGNADDLVTIAAKTVMSITMQEATEHINQYKFKDVEHLPEENIKKLAVLGRALVAIAEELDNKDGILKNILVNMTMEKVINGAEEISEKDLAAIDEDDVTEEYVADPNHIDPMFG